MYCDCRGQLCNVRFGLQELFPGHQVCRVPAAPGERRRPCQCAWPGGGYLLGGCRRPRVLWNTPRTDISNSPRGCVPFLPGGGGALRCGVFSPCRSSLRRSRRVFRPRKSGFFLFLQGFPAFVFLSLHALKILYERKGASVLYGDLFRCGVGAVPRRKARPGIRPPSPGPGTS